MKFLSTKNSIIPLSQVEYIKLVEDESKIHVSTRNHVHIILHDSPEEAKEKFEALKKLLHDA